MLLAGGPSARAPAVQAKRLEYREWGCEPDGAKGVFMNVSGSRDGVLLSPPGARRASDSLCECVELGPSAVRCRHLRF